MPKDSSLASRLATWRHGWLLELIALRAAAAAEAVQGHIALWLLRRATTVRSVVNRRWEVLRRDLRAEGRGQAIGEIFARDDAPLIVDEPTAVAFARDLSIDLHAEWLRLQSAVPKGIQLFEFVDLHRGGELVRLAHVWKIKVRGSRADRIRSLVDQMRDVPLPKAIRPSAR